GRTAPRLGGAGAFSAPAEGPPLAGGLPIPIRPASAFHAAAGFDFWMLSLGISELVVEAGSHGVDREVMGVEVFEPDGWIRNCKLVPRHAAQIHVQVLDFEAEVAGHHVLDAATEDRASEAIGHGGLVARLGGLLTSLAVEPGEAAFAVDERVLHDGEAQAAGR